MKRMKTQFMKLLLICILLNVFMVSTVLGKNKNDITMTILYDNYIYKEETQPDLGFSCLIESHGKTILFDTGTDPNILLKNAKIMNKDLSEVDIIVISHNHHDHTGAFLKIVNMTDAVIAYLPYSSEGTYIHRKAKEIGVPIFFEKNLVQIDTNCYLSGEFGDSIKEQSLIIDTKYGLVVIAGCSHPGILNIVEVTKKQLNKNVYMVFGGFHLKNYSSPEQNDVALKLKSLGVTKCGPTHCSGNRNLFKKAFKSNYMELGTGKVIKIEG